VPTYVHVRELMEADPTTPVDGSDDRDRRGRHLSEHPLRSEVQERLLNLVEADTQALVSHSLGTVVAWEVC
jgi:hypothetical protein